MKGFYYANKEPWGLWLQCDNRPLGGLRRWRPDLTWGRADETSASPSAGGGEEVACVSPASLLSGWLVFGAFHQNFFGSA